jgi:hypothetical protein
MGWEWADFGEDRCGIGMSSDERTGMGMVPQGFDIDGKESQGLCRQWVPAFLSVYIVQCALLFEQNVRIPLAIPYGPLDSYFHVT